MENIIALVKKGYRYDIQYNDETGTSHGVFLYDYPGFSGGEKAYDTYQVSGRVGELTGDDKYISNMIITCVFSVLSKLWMSRIRDLRKWLSGTGRLVLSDNPELFYEVRKINYGDIERELRIYGTFSVEFVCTPYEYQVGGEYEYDPEEVLYNPYSLCHPTYVITGNGECTLSVNGCIMTAAVASNLIINTDLMIAYRNAVLVLADDDGAAVTDDDGIMIQTSEVLENVVAYTVGNYEDLYLIEGENQISITQGFELKVIPNWGYAV